MAYTNTWNESVPVGGDAANTADDWLRVAKVDIRERWNSMIGVPIGTALSDPIIPAAAGLTVVRSLSLFIPVWDMSWTPGAGTLLGPGNNTSAGLDVVQATHTAAYFKLGLALPIGVTLGQVRVNVNQAGGTLTYAGRNSKRLNTATTVTDITSWSGAGVTGVLELDGSWNSEVTVDNTYYTVCFSITPSAGTTCTVFGAEIQYTSPNVGVRI